MSDWQYDWYVLGAIALLVLCSLLTRTGYFMFGDLLPLTERMRRALRYAPVAALAAIIVPELLPWAPGDSPQLTIKALASLIAVLVFIRTRNAVWVIVAGMLAFWLIRTVVA
ncbi:AzlD domain-containing protein [Alcaligenes sp. SDU_A2]|uniref:AzlD domain-containing protein n=1 Tax=Alcaligenes sp. SDU_A2 TaxID=3136634 RepID=UPI002B95952A|nr:AzlD domain-containing protein [Alcaligenes sp.]HRL26374.1 AzlD domain-containing protein [Alcaligenes sp.]